MTPGDSTLATDDRRLARLALMPANSPLPLSDLIIILLYLLAMLGVGIWFARRSSQGLAAYFLGDRKMSWWALALSGSASNFDISGTL